MSDFFTIVLIGMAISVAVFAFGLIQQPRRRLLTTTQKTAAEIRNRHAVLTPARICTGVSTQPRAELTNI